MALRLSVLDQSPIPSGSSAAEALARSVELAQHAERLGYHRYWVAEHHGSESFAGCAPEILIGEIAARTSRIRVGSGGVMVMHYSPLKVAEVFRVLAALHPGRIDLGIGRAPGSDGLTAAALAYGNQVGVEYLPARIADLKAFTLGQAPFTEQLAAVRPMPMVDEPPALWMLGSTDEGARLAAHFGLPFCFAHFINPEGAARACDLYRENFQPGGVCPEPQVQLGVFVLCADEAAHAERLAACRDLWRCRVEQGRFEPIPSIAEAEAHLWTESELARVAERKEHQILGTPATVCPQLEAHAAQTGADEVTVISIAHDFRDRLRCYELLAEHLLEPARAA